MVCLKTFISFLVYFRSQPASCLFSKVWSFISSMLLLKRTPHRSLTQVTQIGSGGFFSRDPTLRLLLMSSSAFQTSKPISLLSATPNLPSVNLSRIECKWNVVKLSSLTHHSVLEIRGGVASQNQVRKTETHLGKNTFLVVLVKFKVICDGKRDTVHVWTPFLPFQMYRIMDCPASPASHTLF